MLEEFIDVGSEGLGADEISQRCSGGGQRRLQVLADLTNLRAHIPFTDDLAVVVPRKQAGHEDQLPRNHVTTGEYSTCPPTMRFDKRSGNRFLRSIIRLFLEDKTSAGSGRSPWLLLESERTYSSLPSSQMLRSGR